MSGIEPYQNHQRMQAYNIGSPLSRSERREYSRALARLEHSADLQTLNADLAAGIGQAKVQAVSSVAATAMTAAAFLATRERMLVEAEAGAITTIAYIGQQTTLALAALIEDTLRQVTR